MINFNVKIKSLLALLLLLLFGSNVFAVGPVTWLKERFSSPKKAGEPQPESVGAAESDKGDLEKEEDVDVVVSEGDSKEKAYKPKTSHKRKDKRKKQDKEGSDFGEPAVIAIPVENVVAGAEIGGSVVNVELRASNVSKDSIVAVEPDAALVVQVREQEQGSSVEEPGAGLQVRQGGDGEPSLSRKPGLSNVPPADLSVSNLIRHFDLQEIILGQGHQVAESSEEGLEDSGDDVQPVETLTVEAVEQPVQVGESPDSSDVGFQSEKQVLVAPVVAEGLGTGQEEPQKPSREKRTLHERDWLLEVAKRMGCEILDSPWVLVGKIGSMPLVEWFAGGAGYLADLFSLRDLLARLHLVQKVTESEGSLSVPFEISLEVKRAVTLLTSAYLVYFFYNKLSAREVAEGEAVTEGPEELVGTSNEEAIVNAAENYLQSKALCEKLQNELGGAEGEATEEVVQELVNLQTSMADFEDRMCKVFGTNPSFLKQVESAFLEGREPLVGER